MACAQGKSSRKGISKIPVTHATIKFFRKHIDLGIVGIKSIAGNLYFCTITDDYTCFCFVLFLKLKSEFYKKFVEFYTYIKTQYEHTIKIIRCDNEGEFTSIDFKNFCATNGIVFEFTAPGTPEHNGVAERKNRTLMEGARYILQQAGLNNKFWADAVYFTNYVENQAPTKIVENSTPFELMLGHKPDISNLHVFGCPATVLIQTQLPKLTSKINKCFYIGLNQEGEGDRFYNLSTHKIIVS